MYMVGCCGHRGSSIFGVRATFLTPPSETLMWLHWHLGLGWCLDIIVHVDVSFGGVLRQQHSDAGLHDLTKESPSAKSLAVVLLKKGLN